MRAGLLCARAANGHPAAAPPTNEMKLRRLMNPSSRGAEPTTPSTGRNGVVHRSKMQRRLVAQGHSRHIHGRQGFAESPLCLQQRPNLCAATNRRDVPIAVVSGLINSKKLLRCTFGDNLERRPKCWIGVLRVGGIVHVRQHCASVPPYGLIGRTSSSAPFRFSSVDNRHADEAQACRRRRVFEWRPFWAKGCNPLTPA